MKKGTIIGLLIVFAVTLYIAFFWESLDAVRALVHTILDPTFGALIAWNTLGGFIITVAIISLVLTLAQKFFTNQEALKKHKERITALRKQSKEHKPGSDKHNEISMEMFQIQFKEMMPLTMSSFAYTGIPIILFFRWFQETLDPIYGGLWLLYYIIVTLIFSSIFRKVFNVA